MQNRSKARNSGKYENLDMVGWSISTAVNFKGVKKYALRVINKPPLPEKPVIGEQ